MKKALFSLYDLSRVEILAEKLVEAGWEIIASKETVAVLARHRIPATDITGLTGYHEDLGFPPTLHPKIEHLLTGAGLKEGIDLVYVLPYPMSVGNDIGGRTLLALAAKGRRIPVMTLEDMETVVAALADKGAINEDLHQKLLDKTNGLIGQHYLNLVKDQTSYESIRAGYQYDLINGENPYQVPAALFSTDTQDALSLGNLKRICGEKPCFTNLADSDAIIQTMCLCAQAFHLKYGKIPYICVVAKHGNACGLAIDWESPHQAIEKALFTNPRAIWGGEAIVNFPIDEALAGVLLKSDKRQQILGSASWMLDVIIAPLFSQGAIEILGKRKERKLFANDALLTPYLTRVPWTYRFVRGGFLRQPPAGFVADFSSSRADVDSLIIAWAAAFSSNHGGNEVALAKQGVLISCAGGPSTIEAAQIAVFKAKALGADLASSVFAADAFFPYTDAPAILVQEQVVAGVVPAGGKNFQEVKRFFEDRGTDMFYLPECYRGFCRH